jgi:hypothetical protein
MCDPESTICSRRMQSVSFFVVLAGIAGSVCAGRLYLFCKNKYNACNYLKTLGPKLAQNCQSSWPAIRQTSIFTTSI